MSETKPSAFPKAPDVIYLNVHDNPDDVFSWTWCADKIHDDDVKYLTLEAARLVIAEKLEAEAERSGWETAAVAWLRK